MRHKCIVLQIICEQSFSPQVSSDNEPKQLVTNYARLALVSNDHVTLNDEDLTRFTLKKAVDKVQMRKELLGELRDIFHHHDKPCPRLILIMGGPGEYYKVLMVVIYYELCRYRQDNGLLQLLYLWKNDLTAVGMEHVMKIVMASESPNT